MKIFGFSRYLIIAVLFLPIGFFVDAQSLNVKGTLFLTAFPPDGGEIVMGLHEPSSSFQTLLNDIPTLQTIACGPDSNLYIATFRDAGEDESVQQIQKYNNDGSLPTVIFEYETDVAFIKNMIFHPDGDLIFNTFLRNPDPLAGIYRISNFITSQNELTEPEQLLTPENFSDFEESSNNGHVSAFLRSGPFAGDLLIVDSPNLAFVSGGRVLRAIAPDFTNTVEFIAPRLDSEGEPFQPAGLVVNSEGNVFIADFTNNKIIEFDDQGNLLKDFASLPNANRLAIGPDDRLYATNTTFQQDGDEITRGTLSVYDTLQEELVVSLGFGLTLFELAVCNEDLQFPIEDQDSDGVPDADDFCPTFPGKPETNGC